MEVLKELPANRGKSYSNLTINQLLQLENELTLIDWSWLARLCEANPESESREVIPKPEEDAKHRLWNAYQ